MWECVRVFSSYHQWGLNHTDNWKLSIYAFDCTALSILLHRCFDKTVLPNKLALLTLLTAVGRTCCFQGFGNQTDLVALYISWDSWLMSSNEISETSCGHRWKIWKRKWKKWSWVLPNCSEPLDHDFVDLHVLPSIRAFSTWPFRSCF